MPVFYADPSPTYQPAMRLITAITNAVNAAVTTSFDHDYITGTIVRILVPDTYGMYQLNQRKGTITVTGTDSFTIDIDTTNFDTFVVPTLATPPEFYLTAKTAQVVPIGEINSSLLAATQNVLPTN